MNIFFNACIFLITLSLATTSSSNFNISNNKLNFNLNDIEEVYDEGYLRLKKQNQNCTQDIGLPELPIYSTLYMIESNKNYSFEIVVNESYTVDDVDIFPYQGLEESDKRNNLIIDSAFYNSDEVYPVNNVMQSDRVWARNMELIPISIIPYSYNLKTKQLEIFTNVEIIVSESESPENRQTPDIKRSRLFEQLYRDMIVNFEDSSRFF